MPGSLAGTRANEFEENDSDKEPSKSISVLPDVTGALPLGIVEAAIKKSKMKNRLDC